MPRLRLETGPGDLIGPGGNVHKLGRFAKQVTDPTLGILTEVLLRGERNDPVPLVAPRLKARRRRKEHGNDQAGSRGRKRSHFCRIVLAQWRDQGWRLSAGPRKSEYR